MHRRAIRVARLDDLRVDADLAQLVRYEFGGPLHMLGGDALGGNRLQRDLTAQQIDDAAEIGFDPRAQLVGKHCGHDAPYCCVRHHPSRRHEPAGLEQMVISAAIVTGFARLSSVEAWPYSDGL